MLADYEKLVTDLVRDDADRLSLTQIGAAILLAVHRYSEDRPRIVVEDVTGVSGHTVAAPAAWQADFSALRSIETPVGEVPPSVIDVARYGLYQTPTGGQIMLLDALPAASTVRLTYTLRHQVDEAVDTVPIAHREACAKWAAGVLCDQLAALYANEQDSTISADSVRTTSKAQEYARRARDYRAFYLAALGLDEKKSAPAGMTVGLDSRAADGQNYLYHRR